MNHDSASTTPAPPAARCQEGMTVAGGMNSYQRTSRVTFAVAAMSPSPPIAPVRTPALQRCVTSPSAFALVIGAFLLHRKSQPKTLRLGSQAAPYSPLFPTSIFISLIPKDIPGSFCESRFFRLTRRLRPGSGGPSQPSSAASGRASLCPPAFLTLDFLSH